MKFANRIVLLSFVLFSCVGCDQTAKLLASTTLENSSRVYLSGMLRLELAHNPGAFLSLGDGLPEAMRSAIFCWGAGVLLLTSLVFALLSKRLQTVDIVGIGLCVAGGVSNLIDRLRFGGAVVDFLNVGIGSVRTGIFNIADMLILAGAAVLSVSLLRNSHSGFEHEKHL